MDKEIEYIKAYTELACLLAAMPKEMTEQIPPHAKSAIKSKYDEKYAIKFDKDNPVEKYNFSRKMKSLLAVLKYNCWASESEKQKMMSRFDNNAGNPNN